MICRRHRAGLARRGDGRADLRGGPRRTTDVLFEAAHWDPRWSGRTARRHRLFSEAAKRWERGVDRGAVPGRAARGRRRCCAEHGGGTVGKRVLDLDYPAAAGAASPWTPPGRRG